MGRSWRNAVAKPKGGTTPWTSTTRPSWLDQVDAERAAERAARQHAAFRRAYTEKRVSDSLFPGDL